MNKRNFERRIFYSLLIAGLSFSLSSCHNTNTKRNAADTTYGISGTDSAGNLNRTKFYSNSLKLQSADYLVHIYANSLFSLKLSKDALTHKTSNRTKNIASYLIKKHTALNKEIKQIANQLNVSLPDDITNEQKNELADLTRKKGPEYEQNYFNLILFQHKNSLTTLRSAEKSSEEAIRNWAKESTPGVETYIDSITSGQKAADSLDVKSVHP